MPEPKHLDADALYTRCDAGRFSFRSTEELEDLTEIPGQARTADESNKLPEEERGKIRGKIEELDQELTRGAVNNLMEELRGEWQGHASVLRYFDAVR